VKKKAAITALSWRNVRPLNSQENEGLGRPIEEGDFFPQRPPFEKESSDSGVKGEKSLFRSSREVCRKRRLTLLNAGVVKKIRIFTPDRGGRCVGEKLHWKQGHHYLITVNEGKRLGACSRGGEFSRRFSFITQKLHHARGNVTW